MYFKMSRVLALSLGVFLIAIIVSTSANQKQEPKQDDKPGFKLTTIPWVAALVVGGVLAVIIFCCCTKIISSILIGVIIIACIVLTYLYFK